MPTTPSTINYYIAADGTLRDGSAGSIAQTPRIYYGTEYAVTLSFPASTIVEGDQLQVAVNRTRTFFSSASATGDAPVAAVAKHDVTAAEADAQAVTLTLSTNTRAMIDQVNGIDHPVRGFFGVHLLRGQSFISLAVADAFMLSVESGPDAISPPLPILDYPTRQEMNDAVMAAQNSASAAKTSEDNADASANAAARDAQAAGQSATNAGNSATLAESYAVGGTGTRPGEDTDNAKYYLEQLGQHETNARAAADEAAAWAEGTPQQVAPYGGENSAKGYATTAAGSASSANTSATQAAGSAGAASRDATAAVTAKNAAETAQGKAETAQGKAETAQTAAETAQGKAEDAQDAAETAQGKAEDAQGAAETAQGAAVSAKGAAETAATNAEKIAEGSDADVEPLGLEHSAKGWAQEAGSIVSNKRDILQTLVSSSSTSLEVEAGKSYKWTVSAASTISMAAADKVANKETRIDIYIDLQTGGSVAGSGVTIADAVLQSGWYKLIWDGTTATLYSTKAGGAESYITIPAATTAYSLQDNKHYQHKPDSVPTYTLPAVTMDGLVHEITILVDFLHVTSCSFVDASNVPVTLQSAISPQIGEAYVFRCYWYGKWRVVPLKIRNAATATSSTGVVSVSDAVAGDALALKMVAPRSVVVNQLISENGILAAAVITSSTRDANHSFVIEYNNTTDATAYATFTMPAQGVHKLLCKSTILASTGDLPTRLYINTSNQNNFLDTSAVVNLTRADSTLYMSMESGTSGTLTLSVQAVDLTQYFNGDSTLIDSIQSWDDLVAYDSRFASYVEYNTGTVVGVTPQVKVTGKNLADPSVFTANGGVLQEDGSYYWSDPRFMYDKTIFTNTSKIPGQLTVAVSAKYPNGASNVGVIFYIKYTDGTQEQVINSAFPKDGMFHRQINISNSNKIVSRVYGSYAAGIDSWMKNFQIEFSSSATAYEPYHDGGTAQAPEALFGLGAVADSFDCVSGVTTQYALPINLGGRVWIKSSGASSTGIFYVVNYAGLAEINVDGDVFCTDYVADRINKSWASYDDKTIHVYIAGSDKYIVIRDMSKASLTATEFKTAMADKLLYIPLATPTTSQSTSTQISLQAGNNVAMQTDGGRTLEELSMTYENLPTD